MEEAYPRPFVKPRIPIYFEYLIDAGEEVRKVVSEMGIPLDTSDYQPLPDWKPCPSYPRRPDYDLFMVNTKVPSHTHVYTSGNVLLDDLSVRHGWHHSILINAKAARAKKIKDEQSICVEPEFG